jgi:hypothetical protein
VNTRQSIIEDQPQDGLESSRDGVRAVCGDFPGSYRREFDRMREYPVGFVEALTALSERVLNMSRSY